MESIVCERIVDPPVPAEHFPAVEERFGHCLQANRIRHVLTYVATDGRRMACLYEAPDLEAIRRANRQAGMPAKRLYQASVHRPPADGNGADAEPAPQRGAPRVVVERAFETPAVFDEIQALEDKGAWCLDQYNVRFLVTLFSADRRRMLCVYQAPDAESVRIAQRKIGMPVSDVWPAVEV
jgi:hypothetical protein